MGQYILNVDKSGRFTLPMEVREHVLPGDRLAVYVGVPSIPGNEGTLAPGNFKYLKLITESKYNEIVANIANLPESRQKRDVKAWFGRYVTLRFVDNRGRIALPKQFLKEVLAFEPPGQLVLLDIPGEVTLTTYALHDEACRRAEKELWNNPIAREEFGL